MSLQHSRSKQERADVLCECVLCVCVVVMAGVHMSLMENKRQVEGWEIGLGWGGLA